MDVTHARAGCRGRCSKGQLVELLLLVVVLLLLRGVLELVRKRGGHLQQKQMQAANVITGKQQRLMPCGVRTLQPTWPLGVTAQPHSVVTSHIGAAHAVCT